LTESETEYVVNAVKHIFSEHIVIQFNITNTLPGQQLSSVVVKVESQSEDLVVVTEIPCATLSCDVPGVAYILLNRPAYSFPTGTLSNTLKFVVKELDSSTGEVIDDSSYDDEYQLEELEVAICDYVQKTFVGNFQQEWDALGEDAQVVETFALTSMRTLKDAISEISEFLGMQACDRSETVAPNKDKHILYLSGVFVGGTPILARARMKLDPSSGVALELTVRSTNQEISAVIARSF